MNNMKEVIYMAKRLYFGWAELKAKESGKPFKMITLGKESDVWHGIEVRSKFLPVTFNVPSGLTPGQMLDVVFDELGNVESISVSN